MHCQTSTASSWSQWALPDLNRELQISLATARPQPRAPDLSGHCLDWNAGNANSNCCPLAPVGAQRSSYLGPQAKWAPRCPRSRPTLEVLRLRRHGLSISDVTCSLSQRPRPFPGIQWACTMVRCFSEKGAPKPENIPSSGHKAKRKAVNMYKDSITTMSAANIAAHKRLRKTTEWRCLCLCTWIIWTSLRLGEAQNPGPFNLLS